MQARVEPIRGPRIYVETTGFFGGFASDDYKTHQAWDKIQTEGTRQLLQAFANGMTITRTAYGQLDFAMGHRPLGVVPNRPYLGTDEYLVNLRQALRPGSIAVDGPFPAGAPVMLDAAVAPGGRAVGYHAYCQDYVMTGYNRLFQEGKTMTVVNVPSGTTWIQPGQEVHARLAPPDGCAGKWVLVTGLYAPPPPPNLPPNLHLPQDVPPTIYSLGVRLAQR
jgi:hypothetical protein